MSIALTGPAGYEFQYQVTAWLTLLFWKPEFVFVESGLEDASFQFDDAGQLSQVELQVKREKSSIQASRLAAWLAHFPARQAEGCLLEWLREDDSRKLILVAGGRVENALTPCLWAGDNIDLRLHHRQARSDLKITYVKKLKKSLGLCYRTNTGDLARRRRERCAKLAREIPVKELQSLSRRILILEKAEPKAMEERAALLLTSRFRVPQSLVSRVFESLTKIVKEARGLRENIVPRFEAILNDSLVPRIFSGKVHVPRKLEKRLAESIGKDSLLLLAGPTLCGKTQTARVIAQSFSDSGFNCRETGDLGEARRFLLDPTTPEDRLVVLEDPLGKLEPVRNSIERLRDLRALADDLPAHRKLIVTSRSDILQSLAAAGASSISEQVWHDLALEEPDQAVEVWRAHAEMRGVDLAVTEKVAAGLLGMGPDNLLQAGQLRHLASQSPEELAGKTFDELVHVARFDARDLGVALLGLNSGMRDVLVALALTASTLTPVLLEDLSYILMGGDDLPGKRKDDLAATTFHSPISQPLFPSYSPLSSLTPDYRWCLDHLESRGILDAGTGYRFSHPTYEQASVVAIQNATSLQFRSFIAQARRATLCLAPETAKIAVEKLHQLRERERGRPERIRELEDLLFQAFDSIFPVIGDASLRRFLEEFVHLDGSMQRRILDIVQRRLPRQHEVLWHAGNAWYDPRDTLPVALIFGHHADEGKLAEARASLRQFGPGSRLAPEYMWTLLQSYRVAGQVSESTVLDQALRYDETLIRGEAAFLLLRDYATKLPELLAAVLRDPDPFVLAEAVRSFLKNAEQFDDADLAALAESLVPALEQPSRALATVGFLTHFEEATGHFDGSAPWKVWAQIAPPIIRALPRHALISEGRLYATARQGLTSVAPDLALSVLEAWLEWIEDSLRLRMPEDYGLGVTELLLRVTGQNEHARRSIFNRLLVQADTAFSVFIVRDLVNGWGTLAIEERRSVLELLQNERRDHLWLRAAALTARVPPGEIVGALLGNEMALSLPAPELLLRFPENLLRACLSIHVGHPGPLYRLGLRYTTEEPWKSIILWIARDPSHPVFDLAIRDLLGHLAGEGEGLETWRYLVDRSDKQVCSELFAHLLRWTVRVNWSPLRDHWRAFLQSPCGQLFSTWAERIIDSIREIEISNNLEVFLGITGFAELLMERFPVDREVVRLLPRPLGAPDSAVKRAIALRYERNPPQLLRTHDLVLAALGEGRDSQDPLVQRVWRVRSEWFDRGSEERDLWNDHYELTDWIWSQE